MPCSYDPSPEETARYERERITKVIKPKLNKLTRLLCEACQILEQMESESEVFHIPSGLSRWWKAHKKKDAKRKLK